MNKIKIIIAIILVIWGVLLTFGGFAAALDAKENKLGFIIVTFLFGVLPLLGGAYILIKRKKTIDGQSSSDPLIAKSENSEILYEKKQTPETLPAEEDIYSANKGITIIKADYEICPNCGQKITKGTFGFQSIKIYTLPGEVVKCSKCTTIKERFKSEESTEQRKELGHLSKKTLYMIIKGAAITIKGLIVGIFSLLNAIAEADASNGNGKKENSNSGKATTQKPAYFKCCVTCDHWHGDREPIKFGGAVKYPKDYFYEGKCYVKGNLFPMKKLTHQSCSDYRKWNSLK